MADEPRHAERPWLSIAPRDHQPRRLAVSPLRCERARCRRSPGPPRPHGVLRSDPAVVPHGWFSRRAPAPATAYGPIRAPSCRRLPPAHTAPRATPAPGQLSRAGTTTLVRAWTRPHPLARWPSPGASGASSGTTKTLFSHWGCRHDRRLTRTAITIPSTGALDDRYLDSPLCTG